MSYFYCGWPYTICQLICSHNAQNFDFSFFACLRDSSSIHLSFIELFAFSQDEILAGRYVILSILYPALLRKVARLSLLGDYFRLSIFAFLAG